MKNLKNEKKSRIEQRKEREKRERNKEIIEAAKRLFISKDFNEIRMEDIAFEAALSKGTLYNYFESKEDLHMVVATQALNILNAMYKEINFSSKTSLEQIMAMGNATYRFSKDFPGFFRIIGTFTTGSFFLIVSEKESKEITLSQNEMNFVQARNTYNRYVNGKIKNALKKGDIRSDLNPSLLQTTLVILTTGIISELQKHHSYLEFLDIEPDDIVNLVFEWITEGLKANKRNEMR